MVSVSGWLSSLSSGFTFFAYKPAGGPTQHSASLSKLLKFPCHGLQAGTMNSVTHFYLSFQAFSTLNWSVLEPITSHCATVVIQRMKALLRDEILSEQQDAPSDCPKRTSNVRQSQGSLRTLSLLFRILGSTVDKAKANWWGRDCIKAKQFIRARERTVITHSILYLTKYLSVSRSAFSSTLYSRFILFLLYSPLDNSNYSSAKYPTP